MKIYFEAMDGTKHSTFEDAMRHEIHNGTIQDADLILKDDRGQCLEYWGENCFEIIIRSTEAAATLELINSDELTLPEDMEQGGHWVWDKYAYGWAKISDYIPTLTNEIEVVITNCPRRFDDDTEMQCLKHCPLAQVCREYWTTD